MKLVCRLLMLTLCLLSLFVFPPYAASGDEITAQAEAHLAQTQRCLSLLTDMRLILLGQRHGQTLTETQQQTWRAWNTTCTESTWQRMLQPARPKRQPIPVTRCDNYGSLGVNCYSYSY
jgi:hypothetical protein